MSDEQLTLELVALIEDRSDAPPLTIIRLTPDGQVTSRNGNFTVDEESGRLVQEDFDRHGADLPIDYEHQSLGGKYAAPDGKAPAAGWVKRVWYKRGQGIMAEVEWTENGQKMIRAKEYKYLSPTVIVRKTDRKCVGIDSAALTNKPAIQRMDALAAKHVSSDLETKTMSDVPEEAGTPDMLLGELKAALTAKGVTVEGDNREAILKAAIAALTGETGEKTDEGEDTAVAASVRAELGLQEGADKDAVLLAMSRLKEQSGASTELTAMKAELAEIKDREADRNAKELVATYVTANKLNPNNKDQMTLAHSQAKSDPEGFTKWMEASEAYAPPGLTRPPTGVRVHTSAAQDDEALIANAMKEHDGNYGNAVIALQTKLLDEECERMGCTRKRATENLTPQHPKIFGEAE